MVHALGIRVAGVYLVARDPEFTPSSFDAVVITRCVIWAAFVVQAVIGVTQGTDTFPGEAGWQRACFYRYLGAGKLTAIVDPVVLKSAWTPTSSKETLRF